MAACGDEWAPSRTSAAAQRRSGRNLTRDSLTSALQSIQGLDMGGLEVSFGKGAARRIRRDNKVPAVIYGHGNDPIHVTLPGHDTLMAVAPRCNSMRISSAGIGAAGARSTNGRNDGGALGVGLSLTGAGTPGSAVGATAGLASASTTHLRTMFAFRPLANATAAIDTPGCRHAWTTCSLNSGACRRRVRLLGNSIPEVFMCPQ